MRPEARDKVLAAVDELAKMAGSSSVEDMTDKTCTTLERLAAWMGTIRTREQIIQALDKLEATPAEEKLLLSVIRWTPRLATVLTTKFAKKVAGDSPGFPTGRKRALESEKQVEVINFIAKLYREGIEVRMCVHRASRKFGLGFRSVERIWHSRAEILESGPEPHFDDVVKKLNNL